jgi:hypothetical protein
VIVTSGLVLRQSFSCEFVLNHKVTGDVIGLKYKNINEPRQRAMAAAEK